MNTYHYIQTTVAATPRNKRLTDGIQKAASTGGGGGTVVEQAEQYWKLITEDADGNTLAQPYILTTYPAASELNITAYKTTSNDIILPIASKTALGAVKIGSNLSITSDGVLSATASSSYELPTATANALGGIKVGSNLSITSDGVLSADAASNVAWGSISGKPTYYPTYWNSSYITGLPTYYPTSWSNISSKPTYFNTYWSSSYITGLPSSFAPSAHTHTTSDISDRTTYIDLLANTQTITGQKTFTQDIIGNADVIAYSTGGSTQAAFKYWYPYVSSDGTLSWSDSTSTTIPSSVNIMGPSGTWNGGTVTASTTFQAGVSISGYTWPYLAFTSTGATTAYISQRGDSSLYFCFGSTNTNKASISSAGAMWIAGTLTQSSDIRLKNRGGIVSGILDKIDSLDAFYYTIKDDSSNTQKIGVSAQEVQALFPELVASAAIDATDIQYLSVDYSTLGAMIAINGLKEMKNIVAALNERIKKLEGKAA